MDPKIKTGISTGIAAAKTGMQAVGMGRKAWALKNKLPGEKKKAAAKALQKAMKKADKQAMKRERKQYSRVRNRKALRRTKGLGRTALAIWNRFF